jgi:hypothetical protein
LIETTHAPKEERRAGIQGRACERASRGGRARGCGPELSSGSCPPSRHRRPFTLSISPPLPAYSHANPLQLQLHLDANDGYHAAPPLSYGPGAASRMSLLGARAVGGQGRGHGWLHGEVRGALASGGGHSCACFLCSADELGFDAPTRALAAEEPLQPGLPASTLRQPM